MKLPIEKACDNSAVIALTTGFPGVPLKGRLILMIDVLPNKNVAYENRKGFLLALRHRRAIVRMSWRLAG
jgi:hypothetical protein